MLSILNLLAYLHSFVVRVSETWVNGPFFQLYCRRVEKVWWLSRNVCFCSFQLQGRPNIVQCLLFGLIIEEIRVLNCYDLDIDGWPPLPDPLRGPETEEIGLLSWNCWLKQATTSALAQSRGSSFNMFLNQNLISVYSFLVPFRSITSTVKVTKKIVLMISGVMKLFYTFQWCILGFHS